MKKVPTNLKYQNMFTNLDFLFRKDNAKDQNNGVNKLAKKT